MSAHVGYRRKANLLIKVRFDENADQRLVLVWSDQAVVPEAIDYTRAANLLFSVIGSGSGLPDRPAVPAAPLASQLPVPARALPRRNLFQSFLADARTRQ